MNLINRNLLVSNLRAYRRTASQHNSLIYLSKAYDEFISEVARMPTVEAEPVRHGHWSIDDSDWFETVYRCTVCKKSSRIRTPYCPHCGAKMDEEAEDEAD